MPLNGAPSASDKAQVRRIVGQVARISTGCSTLDELGRSTLAQSAALLDMGPDAVYCLSLCLDSSDWRVRFWVVDILGYLDNPDAQRPLMRILADNDEDVRVRRQACRSLQRLKIEVPGELKRGI